MNNMGARTRPPSAPSSEYSQNKPVDYELHGLALALRVCHMQLFCTPTIWVKGACEMGQTEITDALTAIVKVLTPLNSDERRRTVDAAMMFLEGTSPIGQSKGRVSDDAGQTSVEGMSANTRAWMKQNVVNQDELDAVFNFNADGTFEIINTPGKSKKEKSINAYVLTGLGKYLATGERGFDDATARDACERNSCYDAANHATYLKDRDGEFTGDKAKGYSMTYPGLKRAAVLVKEVAGTAK
jgi:hypothetical protein